MTTETQEPANEAWLMKGVIPYLGIADCDGAIAFYQRAFGARVIGEVVRDPDNGDVMNASLEINGGVLMLMSPMGEPAAQGGQGATQQLVVSEGQAWWDRAVGAGCAVTMPFAPQFWGDRYGRLRDPFGLDWAINEPGAAALAQSMALPDAEHTLTVDRVIAAPRAAVWRSWTEADLLRQWYCPAPWRVAEADMDVRPGGRFNTVFAGPDGERMANVGSFLEVAPLRRLVFTDAFSEGFVPRPDSFMTGFVQLSDTDDGGTRMVWGARHPTAEQMAKHAEMGFEAGWNAAADQLETLAKLMH